MKTRELLNHILHLLRAGALVFDPGLGDPDLAALECREEREKLIATISETLDAKTQTASP